MSNRVKISNTMEKHFQALYGEGRGPAALWIDPEARFWIDPDMGPITLGQTQAGLAATRRRDGMLSAITSETGMMDSPALRRVLNGALEPKRWAGGIQPGGQPEGDFAVARKAVKGRDKRLVAALRKLQAAQAEIERLQKEFYNLDLPGRHSSRNGPRPDDWDADGNETKAYLDLKFQHDHAYAAAHTLGLDQMNWTSVVPVLCGLDTFAAFVAAHGDKAKRDGRERQKSDGDEGAFVLAMSALARLAGASAGFGSREKSSPFLSACYLIGRHNGRIRGGKMKDPDKPGEMAFYERAQKNYTEAKHFAAATVTRFVDHYKEHFGANALDSLRFVDLYYVAATPWLYPVVFAG